VPSADTGPEKADNGMASLITESWNQLVEWLKQVEALREYGPDRRGTGLKPLNC